jgi:hypothetical protein
MALTTQQHILQELEALEIIDMPGLQLALEKRGVVVSLENLDGQLTELTEAGWVEYYEHTDFPELVFVLSNRWYNLSKSDRKNKLDNQLNNTQSKDKLMTIDIYLKNCKYVPVQNDGKKLLMQLRNLKLVQIQYEEDDTYSIQEVTQGKAGERWEDISIETVIEHIQMLEGNQRSYSSIQDPVFLNLVEETKQSIVKSLMKARPMLEVLNSRILELLTDSKKIYDLLENDSLVEEHMDTDVRIAVADLNSNLEYMNGLINNNLSDFDLIAQI